MSMKIGLVGTGRIGRIHAEALAYFVTEAEVVAVTDINLDSARHCAEVYGIPTVAENYPQMLTDDSIDAVAICSSTDTHAEFIIQAAQAGKHIFCEKPIALNLASIDAALEAVAQYGVKLMVGFNRRFHPNFKRIREVVAEGGIGQPHLVRITSRDSAAPPVEYVKVSGGIFLDMTIHDFDMARYVLGAEVTEIYATGNVLVNPAIGEAGDVDTAVVVMRYDNGAICTIDNSREAVYGYDQRLEVFGAGGMVKCDNNFPHSAEISTRAGVSSAKPLFTFLEIYRQTYIDELKAFIHAIQSNTEPPITGWDGRVPLVMGLAATKSLREGRPVRLSEIG
jgi:myo-inositol 2-dehydrogenase/D-chiro-inositol 1-dehydrogenase